SLQVHATEFTGRISLYDAAGNLLAQSDGQSLTVADPLLVQALAAARTGTQYTVTVQDLDGGSGSYTLTSQFLPSEPIFQAIDVGTSPNGIVTTDFNGDGIPDLAVIDIDPKTGNAEVQILLGVGDGTVQLP